MDFLREILTRLISKSPKFFFIWQCIAGSLSVVGYLPAIMCRWFDLTVSDGFVNFAEDISKVAVGFFAASHLPVLDKNGKLPFSDKSDKKPDK